MLGSGIVATAPQQVDPGASKEPARKRRGDARDHGDTGGIQWVFLLAKLVFN